VAPLDGKRQLEGTVVVVTGAGRGIGRAVAESFAADGAAVVCAARSGAEIGSTVHAIQEAGGRALGVPTDIADIHQVQTMVDTAVSTFGGLDILVANAGAIHRLAPVAEIPPDEWRRVVDVNLTGTYLCARAAIEPMRERGGGRIIVIGSGAGRRSGPHFGPYAAAKAGVSMLVRVLAAELRASDIAVNEVIPGPVRTAMLDDLMPGGNAPLAADNAMGSDWLKDPVDVVPLVRFVAGLPLHGPTGQTYSLLGRDT
jgi:3-oxoacyl-[acyl-carrier protein] reductase